MRPRSLSLATPILATLAIALAVPPVAAAKVTCRPGSGTGTIAHSKTARIFEDSATGNDYACSYSSGRTYYLSSSEHYTYPLVRFAGPYVAFVMSIEVNEDHIGVMNLSTGRLHNYAEVSPIKEAGSECSGTPVCYVTCPEVGSLALKSDGSVAWIATNFLGGNCISPPGPVIEVRCHDRRGTVVVASGTGIDPTSLRLSGSLLRWKDAGASKSASIL